MGFVGVGAPMSACLLAGPHQLRRGPVARAKITTQLMSLLHQRAKQYKSSDAGSSRADVREDSYDTTLPVFLGVNMSTLQKD